MAHIKISLKKTKKDLSDLGNPSNKIEILFRFFFIIASCILYIFFFKFMQIFNGILVFVKELGITLSIKFSNQEI